MLIFLDGIETDVSIIAYLTQGNLTTIIWLKVTFPKTLDRTGITVMGLLVSKGLLI